MTEPSEGSPSDRRRGAAYQLAAAVSAAPGCEAAALGMSASWHILIRDLMSRSWIPVSVGFIGAGTGVSTVCGPLFSGALTEHYS
ncbi:hypothetical protein [Nocardia miyunensis]|uniref:hypothetical protein n=1 Tax=Nocardia miyunensis TaxID=282684 RepID=UPI0012F526A8|nr:hypothetical protein [Nocardia miyunensis]